MHRKSNRSLIWEYWQYNQICKGAVLATLITPIDASIMDHLERKSSIIQASQGKLDLAFDFTHCDDVWDEENEEHAE